MIWTKGTHQRANFQTFDSSREISTSLYFDRLFLWKHHIPLLKALSNLLDLGLAKSRILYFWQVLESIHNFMTELHVLQYLFVRESIKQ